VYGGNTIPEDSPMACAVPVADPSWVEARRLLDSPEAEALPAPFPWRVDIAKLFDCPDVDAEPIAEPS